MKLLRYAMGALLLGVALTACFVNITAPASMVFPRDPVFEISTCALFWVIGIAALIVSLVCLFGAGSKRSILPVAWLATNIFIYGLAAKSLGCHGFSGYLDGYTRVFGLSARHASVLAGMVFGCLLVASYGLLLMQWRLDLKESAMLKMSCPHCGLHIKFNAANAGQTIPCPACKGAIRLRPTQNLKMACFFCGKNIEFPSHALRQKVTCPHCRMDITLQEPE